MEKGISFSDTGNREFDIIGQMKRSILAISAVLSLTAAAERAPLSRYQSVIDRQMFGELPPDFDPAKMPSEVQRRTSKEEKELSAEQEKLKSSIHFSVMNVKSDGRVEVGFTDNSDPKEPCHYFICEGETAGGWKVVEADPDTAAMVLEKDGITLELTLGDNSAKGGGNMKKNASSASAAPARSPLVSTGRFTSLRSRRQQREEAERKRREEDEKRRAAEKAEEEARKAAEKEERAAQLEEQRKQLQAIQEELRRVREARKTEGEGGGNENNDAE